LHYVGARAFDPAADDGEKTEQDSSAKWLQLVRSPRPDAPGIGVRQVETSGAYEACFSVELATVASRAVEDSYRRADDASGLSRNEIARQRAMNALISSLGPSDAVSILYELLRHPGGAANLRIRIHGQTTDADLVRCVDRARSLFDDIGIAMAAGGGEFGFKPLPEPIDTRERAWANALRLLPASVEIHDRRLRSPGFEAHAQSKRVRLPLPPFASLSYVTALVPSLLAAPYAVEVAVRLTRASFNPGQLELLKAAMETLLDGDLRDAALIGAAPMPGPVGSKLFTQIREMMEPWFARADGTQLDLVLQSDHAIPEVLIRLVGGEILQGRPFYARPVDRDWMEAVDADLSQLNLHSNAFPPVLPSPASLAMLGFPRHFPPVRIDVPDKGITLGDIPMPFTDTEVRLADADRSQHCYVIGTSGTGKSSLLLQMIQQDMMAHKGVAVIDANGDLYRQAMEAVPASRRNDVVLMDFTDREHFIGLNFLERSDRTSEFERNFIIHELTEIMWRMYGKYNPQAMGPAFFQYMRNTVALTMEDPLGDRTLLDVPSVLADATLRNLLIAECKDESVRDFWLGIAAKTTHEYALANMIPYVTNKFSEFTQNELVRLIVGQSRSTVNFREVMDRKKILLVNIAKGQLSETDSRFLGMVVTGRIFGAALSRANVPPSRRPPFYLYLDEFQNYTSNTLIQMLAESRKYGLCITAAHQNLGQLPEELAESVLSNTGSRIFMRVGTPDAQRLAPFVSPHYSAQDLISLPDRHAIARIKVNNVPSPMFVMRTRPLAATAKKRGTDVDHDELVKRSRAKYCRPADEVRRQISWRRHRHLLRFSPEAFTSSSTLSSYLQSQRVTRMGDLKDWGPEKVAELFSLELTPTDRRQLENVMACVTYERGLST
jgi:hypothetical protein